MDCLNPCLINYFINIFNGKNKSKLSIDNSALNFLNEYGNPFLKIGSDKNGRNAIEWGVYGVPETFVIDQHGNVLFRHAGPITKAILEIKFSSLIK